MTQPEFTLQTRRDSWDKIQGQLGVRQAAVFEQLRREPAGLTAWEIARRLDWPVYIVRPRLTELKTDGHIRTIGKKFYEATQRLEAVWKLID